MHTIETTKLKLTKETCGRHMSHWFSAAVSHDESFLLLFLGREQHHQW